MKFSIVKGGLQHSIGLSGQSVFFAGGGDLGESGTYLPAGSSSIFIMSTAIRADNIFAYCTSQNTHVLTGQKLYSTGYNEFGQCGVPANFGGQIIFVKESSNGNWIDVSPGFTNTWAKGTNNLWYVVGDNGEGQFGTNYPQNSSFTYINVGSTFDAVRCGVANTFALTAGRLYATGNNQLGQLGTGDYANKSAFTNIAGNFNAIECGMLYSVALSSDGSVLTTGANSYYDPGLNQLVPLGVLGVEGITGRNAFTAISSISAGFGANAYRLNSLNIKGFTKIVSCGASFFALSAGIAGSKWFAVGNNTSGQCGVNNGNFDLYTLTEIPSSYNYIAGGGQHALAFFTYP